MKYLLLPFLTLLFLPSLSAQLVLERDINQEAASSDPSTVAELNGILYFSADDGINGAELYQFDLASEMIQIVANIRPYEDESGITEVLAFDNKIYFSARTISGSNRFLYVHDPADNSTQILMDSDGNDVNDPSNLVAFNGQLFFNAAFGNMGMELGRYDPITNKVELIADINLSGNSFPNFFTEVDGKLWFTATDGISNSRLWRFDPVTEMVENIVYESPNMLYPSMSFLHYFDGKFFFQGFLQSTGSDLWAYDLATNTLLDFPEVSPGISSSSPSGFTEFDGKLYFSARTGAEGRELRVYDPATGLVTLLADLNPSGNGNPGLLMPLNGLLYFTAEIDAEERDLFAYSPDIEEVVTVATLDNNGFPNYLSGLIVNDGSLFLSGRQIATGTELYRYTPGNSNIALAADINQTTIGSDPYLFTPYNGKLYFGATEINSGQEIWVYNPGTGNVDILSDSPGNTAPYNFTVLGDKLFFSGIDPDLGYGLQCYDENTGMITPTSFITPGQVGHITDITAYNDLLCFRARDETLGSELFIYNPTSNLFSIIDINPTGDANPEKLYVFQNELYFQASDGITGTELWKYNDATEEVSLVSDINVGAGDSDPDWFIAYAGELYFSAFVPSLSQQIYSYNSSSGVVTQRTDFSGNFNPEYFTIYRDKLFFDGQYSSSTNADLGYYDAATNEMVLIEDLTSGASNPRYLTVFNDKIYFAANSDDYGQELWEYNDTSLSIVADLRPGVPDSDPTGLTFFNDKLYFAANDGIRGTELWSIAACLNIFIDTEPQIGPDGAGSIDLTIEGGLPPYTINWSNGAQTEDIEDLEPGIYTVTVSDASGCLSEVVAEVTFVSSTSNMLSDQLVTLYPNPNSGAFTMEVGALEAEAIDIFDLNGRLIYQKVNLAQMPIIEVQLRYAPAGVYVVQLKTKQGLIQKKLILE